MSVVPATNNVVFYPTSPQNPTVALISVVTNQGNGVAADSWGYTYDTVYVSTNTSISGAVASQSFQVSGTLAPGASYTLTNTITLPQQSGTYYLIYLANSTFVNSGQTYDGVYEANTANNALASAAVTVTYQVQPPDLAPVSVVPATNNVAFYPASPQNPTVALISVVTNQGNGVAADGWGYTYDTVYVSTNTSSSGAVASQSFQVSGTLAPGASYTLTNTITLPQQSGTYYLIYLANSTFVNSGQTYDGVYEANTANNALASAAVTVTYQLQPPDLAPISLASPASGASGTLLQVACLVTNQGSGSAVGYWYDGLYFSANSVLDSTALQLSPVYQYHNVPAGGSYTWTNYVSLPQVAPGPYYLFVVVDDPAYGDVVYEVTKTNNVLGTAAGAFTVLPPAQLVVSNLAISGAAVSGRTITVSWTAANVGVVTAGPAWSDRLYVSTTPTLSGAIQTYEWRETQTLPPGASYSATNTITLPAATSGTYYLLLQADAYNELGGDTSTNSTSSPLAFPLTAPDLAVSSLAVTGTPVSGLPLNLMCVVTNQGNGPAEGAWSDRLYLCTNATVGGAIQTYEWRESQVLAPGSSYTNASSVALPSFAAGTYYLIYVADVYNEVPEEVETNNASSPLTIALTAPGLAVLNVTAPVQVTRGIPFDISWTDTNQGSAPAAGPWTDNLYFSTNGQAANAVLLANFTNAGGLGPSQSLQYTQSVTINGSAIPDGPYFVVVLADAYNVVPEPGGGNKTGVSSQSVTLESADLVVDSVAGPPSGRFGQQIIVTYVVRNAGTAAATANWSDRIYLCPGPSLSVVAVMFSPHLSGAPVECQSSDQVG